MTQTAGNWISFPNLGQNGITFNLDPVAFTLWGAQVKWSYIFTALAFALGIWMYLRFAKKSEALGKNFAGFTAVTAACAVIGARLFYSLPSAYNYKHDANYIFQVAKPFYENFWEAVNIFDGGMGLYGAVLLGLIGGALYCKLSESSLGKYADCVAVAMPLSQALFDLGLFFNQTAFGVHSDSALAINGNIIEDYVNIMRKFWIAQGGAAVGPNQRWVVGRAVTPCIVYEILGCLAIFALLLVIKKIRVYRGEMFVVYLLTYSTLRGITEAQRVDAITLGDARLTQILAFAAAAVALVLEIVLRWQIKEGKLKQMSLYVDEHSNDGFENEDFVQRVYKGERPTQPVEDDADKAEEWHGESESEPMEPDMTNAGTVWTAEPQPMEPDMTNAGTVWTAEPQDEPQDEPTDGEKGGDGNGDDN